MRPIEEFMPGHLTLDNSAIKFFYCKTVGETKDNRDGSSRQKIIQSDASTTDPVYFNPEKNVALGLNAMSVHLVKNDKQIGYLPMYIAEDMTKKLDSLQFTGVITEIAARDPERRALGVNLAIIDCPMQTAQEELNQWVDAHVSKLVQPDADVARPESKTSPLLWVCWVLATLVMIRIIQTLGSPELLLFFATTWLGNRQPGAVPGQLDSRFTRRETAKNLACFGQS